MKETVLHFERKIKTTEIDCSQRKMIATILTVFLKMRMNKSVLTVLSLGEYDCSERNKKTNVL